MERSPGTPAEEHHGSTSDKKDKKRRDRTILRVPLIVGAESQSEGQAGPRAEKPKASALEAALANLAAQRHEDSVPEAKTAEKPVKADEVELVVPEADEANSAAERADEHDQSEAEVTTADASERPDSEEFTDRGKESEETYEPLPLQELTSIDLSGGEVVIHLQGDQPVTERVKPLEMPPIEAVPPTVAVEAPVTTPQTEQQHQAHVPEQLAPVAAVETTDTVPMFDMPAVAPETSHSSMPSVEMLQPHPEDVYPQPALPNIATAVSGERPATKREVEDMAYRAEQAGQNRGVLTGLLAGGAYEHFKHKRRERRKDKHLQEQGKQLEAARQGYNNGLQEQARRNAEANAQYESVTERVGSVEQRLRSQANQERPKTVERVATEPTEQLEIPTEHRLEASSWHSIEVDARTGKVVENPTFQYGQEYHRERAHETALASQQQANEATTAAGGPSAVAAGSAAPPSDDRTTLPPVYIPSASTQRPAGLSTQDVAKKQNPADDRADPAPLWPWVVALVAVAISLVVVLH